MSQVTVTRGRRGQRWPDRSKLEAMFLANLRYADISRIIERTEGWAPSAGTISAKRAELGLPARHVRRDSLIPWILREEHKQHRYAYMLRAEAKRREIAEAEERGEPHGKLKPKEEILISNLNDLLWGRGRPLVICYRPDLGFFLCDRSDDDLDIIRP